MASPHIEIPVGDRSVRVSNPDRIHFPEHGYTKRQVVEYFLAVGEGILRATRDRPTTLERWPSGVFEGARLATRGDFRGADAFYQKRVPKGAPEWVPTAKITFPSGRTADEVMPTEPAVIAWAANLGTLTFHPWAVRGDRPDHPDELRIDLDPQPGTGFGDAVRVTLGPVRELLDELGFTGFVKTSGRAACTCTCGSRRGGPSPRCGGPGSRSRGRWSAAPRTWSPPAGGRRSAARGSSSTSTATSATPRSRRPTASARSRTRRCRPR
ncbi:hypothetical protein GCM10009678_63640 [Actinomadura kijaniata]